MAKFKKYFYQKIIYVLTMVLLCLTPLLLALEQTGITAETQNEKKDLTTGDDRILIFETHKKANSNAGHEYGVRKFSKEDRLDLVEYMKTL